MAQLTGSQIIINLLRQNGIDVVFGLPGGMILPLYNELFVSNFKHVLVVAHEPAPEAARSRRRPWPRRGPGCRGLRSRGSSGGAPALLP